MSSDYRKRSKIIQQDSRQAWRSQALSGRQGLRPPCLPTILLLSFLALCMFPAIARADGGFPIIGVLHAGSHPEGIAVDTQTHMVYIAYEYPSSVVGFDPSSGKVRWSAPVTDSVTDVQVDSNSHYVYVIGSLLKNKQGVLAILDGATG